MASYLDKFKVKSAIENNTKLDLSCLHITTADFMQLSPVYTKELVPGETIKVNQETFTRLAPMPVPTFGRANVHNRGFFVPFRTIFKGWNDFITDTKHVASDTLFTSGSLISTKVPYMRMSDLVQAIFAPVSGLTTGEVRSTFGRYVLYSLQNQESQDLTFREDVNEISDKKADLWTQYELDGYNYQTQDYVLGIKLSAKGRQVLKVLQSLGYLISTSTEYANVTLSALPLLAYLKVYLDWYYPAQYYDDLTRTLLESIINYDPTNGEVAITYQQLVTIFELVTFVNYDSDYFVSAFDNPEGPTMGSASDISIVDITNGTGRNGTTSSSTINNANRRVRTQDTPSNNWVASNTPVLYGAGDSNTTTSAGKYNLNAITQYALNALHKLTDYMKRHQLVGARAMDRYLARFGKSLSAEKLNRSLYLNHMSFGLQIGDVMSQADTSGANLGSYAGKGLGFGQANYEYSTDEYGMFIICTSIVPTVGYYQGIDRSILHIGKLDFWTPEFDQLGNQAISKAELYLNYTNPLNEINIKQTGNSLGLFDGIFGYTPRYAEYKIARDRLTGDFRCSSISAVGDVSDSWHLFREFTADGNWSDNSDDMVHSKEFVTGDDQGQYNRIFYNTQDTADHFVVIHNFNIVSYSPMCALYDTYEFESEGKYITADVNGVKVN